ncbi:MAG: DUF5916 domain-containing protein [Flavitalea sp.]
MKTAIFLLGVLFLLGQTAIAQKKDEGYQLHIKKTLVPVRIDGETTDEGWADAQFAANFNMMLPMDTSKAKVRTDVRMTYDDENLYILAECYNLVDGPYFVESLRRDFAFVKNDNFLVFMDPFIDQTSGFSFGANAAGAQWDASIYEGSKVDQNWDQKWESTVKNTPEKWVFEAAIPFKSIRYKKGTTRWGINFSRLDLKTTEKSSWTHIPRQFPTASLAYTGVLVWDAPPPTPRMNVSLIPYVLGSVIKNYESGAKPTYHKDVGVDAKISLTPALNLDLTVNPDFSQVEVDKQVTNLDRYELFYPERRQFFLENGDLFANIGYATLRPFFSRRIGLGTPIHYGLRLSGKLDKVWRVGLMNVESARQENNGLPTQNYTVANLQRKIFSRSNIGIFFINKQSYGLNNRDSTGKRVFNAYNRNVGLEYNLATANNLWTGKMLFIKSFIPGPQGRDIVNAGNLQYSIRKWTVSAQYEYVGKNYVAEAGYVPRSDYFKINPILLRNFFPKGGTVLVHGPKLSSTLYFNTKLKRTDYEHLLTYNITFRSQAVLAPWVAKDYVELLLPFDPTNILKDTLARFTKHYWTAYGADFTSKPQSIFTYTFSTRYGGYYANGKRFVFSTELGYRWQPYLNISLAANYNDIKLPSPWNHVNFLLIGPRIDVTMSNKVFFTGYLQYNDQTENMNVNFRFQWRYKPASDLFLVYTDNYYPENLSVRNRAVVLKINYWWNK